MKKRKGRFTVFAALAVAALVAAPVFAGKVSVSSAEKDVLKGLKKRDEKLVAEGLHNLRAFGGKKAMSAIVKVLAKYSKKGLSGGYYWQLISGATAFKDEEGLKELGKFIVSKQKTTVAKDLLFGLQNNVSPKVMTIHQQVLAKGSFDQKLLTVDQLATIRRVEAGDLLVSILEKERSDQLKQRAKNAFQALTGKSMGDAANWIGWWKSNRDKEPFKKEGEDDGGLGAGDAGGSVTRDGARGGEIGSLERLKKGRVIVIQGGSCCKKFDHNYDHIDQVLEKLGVKCEVMDKKQWSKIKPSELKGIMAVLLNCTQNNEHCICPTCKPTGATNMRMQTCGSCAKHTIVNDKMPAVGVKLLKAFVESGGYFFSEDWGLYEIIEKAWPDIVKVGTFLRDHDKAPPKGTPKKAGERSQAALPKGGQVAVTPAPGASTHPYMRGVFLKPKAEKVSGDTDKGGTVERGGAVGSEFRSPKHKWTIDDDSPSIKIIDRKRVKVLLESDELKGLADGDKSVAFMFHIGRNAKKDKRVASGGSKKTRQVGTEESKPGGRVLHVLSHFGKQNSAADEAALQNLLYNFMLECARRRAPK
jgi:hypothetical protein